MCVSVLIISEHRGLDYRESFSDGTSVGTYSLANFIINTLMKTRRIRHVGTLQYVKIVKQGEKNWWRIVM